MFLFHSFGLVHTPLDVPSSHIASSDLRSQKAGVPAFDVAGRRNYSAMVAYMDEAIAEIESALREKGMWEDTLVVFMSDNGGPVYVPGNANNHPLKGGKYSDWEGGVRTNAFVSGGFVPEKARGAVYGGVISIADWCVLFIYLSLFFPFFFFFFSFLFPTLSW